MRRIGLTHEEFDIDGGSCLRFLERTGEIDEIAFESELEGVKRYNDVAQVVFLDMTPEEKPSVPTKIYDHHGSDKKITAFDLLLDEKGVAGFDPQKVYEWKRLVQAADNQKCNDSMDVHHLFAKMHGLILLGHQVYQEWFVPLFDSFFDKDENIPEGKEVLRNTILEFLNQNPDSLLGDFIERENWLRRLEKPKEQLQKGTFFFRNILRFISHMNKKTARNWILLSLKALERHQISFIEDLESIKRTSVEVFGKTLVASQVTTSRTFDEAVGHYVVHPDKFEVPPQVKERILDRSKVWFVIKVSPEERNFQVFPRGEDQQVVSVMCNEIVKALRAEILVRRGLTVPTWEELCKADSLTGTEHLFYNKKTNSQIMWGTLKHRYPPASVFGGTAPEIQENLVEIVMHAVDDNYFPYECNPRNCRDCPMYPWQLRKCADRRRGPAVLPIHKESGYRPRTTPMKPKTRS